MSSVSFVISRLMLVVILSLVVLAGCASNKPQISINQDQNFAAINTVYVKPPQNSVNSTLENYLISAISRVMISKGLQPASSEQAADIQMVFLPSTASKRDGKSVSLGVGTGWFGRATGISLGSVFSVPVGEQVSQYQNLQIDAIRNGTYVYSAAGSAELEAADNISIQQALNSLVGELLASYPAKRTD